MAAHTAPEIKQAIIAAIPDDGLKVTETASQYGVSVKAIYRWLQDEVPDGQRNLILENNRLKKENEQLYAMLGKATAMMQRPKK